MRRFAGETKALDVRFINLDSSHKYVVLAYISRELLIRDGYEI